MRNLADAVAASAIVPVEGEFQRHTSRGIVRLVGNDAGGRWGPPRAFAVLYLGRPETSVALEAHRHIIDVTEGMTYEQVLPRRLWRVRVNVVDVLDLRDEDTLSNLGLTSTDLHSPVGEYERCQEVAAAAVQVGLHGIISPAAEGGGETLALFDSQLTFAEIPTVVSVEDEWRIPPRARAAVSDPR